MSSTSKAILWRCAILVVVPPLCLATGTLLFSLIGVGLILLLGNQIREIRSEHVKRPAMDMQKYIASWESKDLTEVGSMQDDFPKSNPRMKQRSVPRPTDLSRQSGHGRDTFEKVPLLLQLKRYDQAKELLEAGIATDPEDDRYYSWLSFSFTSRGRFEDGLLYAEKAISLNPEEEWNHRLRANALLGMRRFDEALVSARASLQSTPWNELSIFVYGQCLLKCGRQAAAKSTALRLRSLYPESAWAHLLLSMIALKDGAFAAAEFYQEKALEIDPENDMAMNLLGLSLQAQERNTEAVQMLRFAASANPMRAINRQNLRLVEADNGFGVLACLIARKLRIGRIELLPVLCYCSIGVIVVWSIGWKFMPSAFGPRTDRQLGLFMLLAIFGAVTLVFHLRSRKILHS